jgi:predicted GTPase
LSEVINKRHHQHPQREREALINLYQIIMQQRREPPLIFILNQAALASGRERYNGDDGRESFGCDAVPIKAPSKMMKLCHLHSGK